jgi:hypothetical protein
MASATLVPCASVGVDTDVSAILGDGKTAMRTATTDRREAAR